MLFLCFTGFFTFRSKLHNCTIIIKSVLIITCSCILRCIIKHTTHIVYIQNQCWISLEQEQCIHSQLNVTYVAQKHYNFKPSRPITNLHPYIIKTVYLLQVAGTELLLGKILDCSSWESTLWLDIRAIIYHRHWHDIWLCCDLWLSTTLQVILSLVSS